LSAKVAWDWGYSLKWAYFFMQTLDLYVEVFEIVAK
jgi:hypothetical protein